MATTVQPFVGTYELDRDHSTVQFAVRHVQVSMFRASFGDVEGRARVKSVSIAEPPEFREHVVRGADFFDADTHPVISFRSSRVELGDDGTATASGELTVRARRTRSPRRGPISPRGKTPSVTTAPVSSCRRQSTAEAGT